MIAWTLNIILSINREIPQQEHDSMEAAPVNCFRGQVQNKLGEDSYKHTIIILVFQRDAPCNQVPGCTSLFCNYPPHFVMAVGALERSLKTRNAGMENTSICTYIHTYIHTCSVDTWTFYPTCG